MDRMRKWNVNRLPPQHGKTFLVTGASSGIGYFIAEQLAQTRAHIVLSGRSAARLAAASTSVLSRVPAAQLSTLVMDLADFGSVRAAVTKLAGLDGAVLNAGVLTQRRYQMTADGHELVYGTNHLGHFLLAAMLYPRLADGARLVTVGSVAARRARMDFDDIEATRLPYKGFQVYQRSKLAQTLFAFELDRRLRDAGSSVVSLVAHPGGALDGLTASRPPVHIRSTVDVLRALPLSPVVQGKDAAAWPAIRALLDPTASGGQLVGPRILRSKGLPVIEQPASHMQDRDVAARLWQLSEKATETCWRLA